MTNQEQILEKLKDAKYMAEWMWDIHGFNVSMCDYCNYKGLYKGKNCFYLIQAGYTCVDGITEWLENEYKDL